MKTTLLVALLAMASAQVRPDPAAEIRAARESSNRALATKDLKAFAETLAPDFVMIRGNGVFVPSRQACIDLISSDFKNSSATHYERIPDKIEISSAAPVAAEHGHWIGTLPNGKRAYGVSRNVETNRDRLENPFGAVRSPYLRR